VGRVLRDGTNRCGGIAAEKSAPVSNEFLMRSQIALDGELYRAMDQLRKQQEWRIRSGMEIDAEVVT
jgi:hypothetical protein